MHSAVQDFERHINALKGRTIPRKRVGNDVSNRGRSQLSQAGILCQPTDERLENIDLLEGAVAHVKLQFSGKTLLKRLPFKTVSGEIDPPPERSRQCAGWDPEKDRSQLAGI